MGRSVPPTSRCPSRPEWLEERTPNPSLAMRRGASRGAAHGASAGVVGDSPGSLREHFVQAGRRQDTLRVQRELLKAGSATRSAQQATGAEVGGVSA